MKSKVRYLTISRIAIEMTTQLSAEDSSRFNKIIFSCFEQLENGEEMTLPETDSPFLNMALREAAGELETGYRNYLQKINARKKAPADQDDPEPESTNDQRSTADQPPIDNRREEKREEKKRSESSESREGMQGGRPLSKDDREALEKELRYFLITPDPQFWSLARKAGYRITLAAIKKAGHEGSVSLAYVVKLMDEAMKVRGQ